MKNFDFKAPCYTEVFKKKLLIMQKLQSSPMNVAAAKKYYGKNPIEFIEDFCVTLDPRKTNMPLMPFILFDKQKEYIKWLLDRYHNREDGLVEKSRDLGVSWLSCAFSVWMFLFYENHSIGFGSNKEENVDSLGNPKSLFEKMRIIIKHLPIQMLPEGWNSKKYFPYMKIINPENGSTLIGEAGVNIGRSGRTTMYFKDECAFYEQAIKIESAISMNSDVKIDISTHNGVGTVFFKKRFSGQYPLFIFDWKDDPRKDDEWYKREKAKLDSISPVITACELDRNPFASVENICIPYEYVKSAINFNIEAEGNIIAGLDVADEGRDANAIAIRKGSRILSLESWNHGNTTQTTRKAYQYCRDRNIDVLNFDSIGVGAGVKGEFWSLNEKEDCNLDTTINPVNVGNSPTDEYFDEKDDNEEYRNRRNKDIFMNLKAELWWKLRRRFEKTYEYINDKKQYGMDELISIPKNEDLIRELTSITYSINENGKIKIESKENLRKRGIKSPNLADALVLAFYQNKDNIPSLRII